MPKWTPAEREWNGCLRKIRHEHWGTALAHFAELQRKNPHPYRCIYPCAYNCGGLHIGKSRTLRVYLTKLKKGLKKLDAQIAHPNWEKAPPEVRARLETVQRELREELEDATF